MNSIRAKFDNLFGATGSTQQQQSSGPQPSASDMLNDKETPSAPSHAGKSKKRRRHGAKKHAHGHHKHAHRHAHARTNPDSGGTASGSASEAGTASTATPVPAGSQEAGMEVTLNPANETDADGLPKSRSAEVLRLQSLTPLDAQVVVTSLEASRRRKFITGLATGLLQRLFPDSGLEEQAETAERPSEETSWAQRASVKKLRRSAWGTQSISATASLMTKKNAWLNVSRSRKSMTTIFERYKQKIEDRFGTCVACFFSFIYDLLKMNFFLAIVWFLFVLFPQAIRFDYSTLKNEEFKVPDLLRGKGRVGKTWLFFGNYQPKIENYYMGFAYFCCILFTLYFSLFWLISSIMMAMQEDGGRMIFDSNNFTYLTFTSWDYSLKNTEATNILCLGIANSFRDLISDVELKKMLHFMRAINKSKLYIRRALVWVVTCIIIAVACFIIWTVMSSDNLKVFRQLGYTSATRSNLIVSFVPSIVLGIVNILFPFAINKLPYFEYYVEPQTEVYISIGRVFALTSANTVCLMLSLRIKMSRENVFGCGGTFFGQELYRILLVDTVFAAIGCVVAYAGYYLVCHQEKREFFLPTAVLRIINTQTLVWFGTMVCPLMPVIGCLNLIVVFAVYYKVIERFCKPTSKRWLQPHRNVFFLMITVLSLCILTITYSITNAINKGFYFAEIFVPQNDTNSTTLPLAKISTNKTCGPFHVTVDRSPFQDILDATQAESPNFRSALSVLFSPIFGITIIVVLSSALYVIVHRLKWEVERRLILLAEVHMERYEGNKLHHHRPKAHPGPFNLTSGSPTSPYTPTGSPPLRFEDNKHHATTRSSQPFRGPPARIPSGSLPPGSPPPGSPPPESPPFKK